jgi:hypothetical protein
MLRFLELRQEGSCQQASSGNGAMTVSFNISHLARAVPERQRYVDGSLGAEGLEVWPR